MAKAYVVLFAIAVLEEDAAANEEEAAEIAREYIGEQGLENLSAFVVDGRPTARLFRDLTQHGIYLTKGKTDG